MQKNSFSENNVDFLNMRDHHGPSGVPLGGIGCGYFGLGPDGHFNRLCVNNVHKDFFPKGQKGFFMAVRQGGANPLAIRLQKDDGIYGGMPGVDHIYYKGLFPVAETNYEKSGLTLNVSSRAYSSVVPHNPKDSALPAVWLEVELHNPANEVMEASVAFSWGDIINRAMKDFPAPEPDPRKCSGDNLPFMKPVDTKAENISFASGNKKFTGVRQFAVSRIKPVKWTFQNYNEEFLVLAEESDGQDVSYLLSYDVKADNVFDKFVAEGSLKDSAEGASAVCDLSSGGEPDMVQSASAVSVKVSLKPDEKKTIRFLLTWFMPEPDMDEIRKGPEGSFFKNCDYGRYYHNWFASAQDISVYAASIREKVLTAINEWQKPILESNMPSWLKFKQINSAYALYTNTVFNKQGLFSTLEGEMGGLGGTQDQKMSSHPIYQKFFTELDITENMQYCNTIGEDGDILHFDLHYYHGIANYEPDKKESPTPMGSMIDNGGSWIIQLAKTYQQTGNIDLLKNTYTEVKRCMDFIASKIPSGFNVPCYYTTYDDAKHPPVLIYAGTIYLAILRGAIVIAEAMGDKEAAAAYSAQFEKTATDVDKLFIEEGKGKGFYCFGCDKDGSNKREDIIFSGHLAGQFMSRYCGWKDVLPFEKSRASIYKHLTTSIQDANDYYAAKIWNWKERYSLDQRGSRCWPFYLESYSSMAAIQLGYVEDGLKIMEHIQLVHHNLGYDWTQNLWNPAEATYMTVPVTWFINDVLAGAAVDVNKGVLTLGPVAIPGTGRLKTPLYYPDFWAMLDYNENTSTCTLEIIKTFGNPVHKLSTIVIAPNGRSTDDAVEIKLPEEFTIKTGAVLDLSAYFEQLSGADTIPSVLKPVLPYDFTYRTKDDNDKDKEIVIDTGEDLYTK